MALRRLVDATVEPLTLPEIKSHLRVTTAADDTYLSALITAARTECEDSQLRRTLIQTDWELTLDAFPCAIPLRMPRVISVTSVKYIDTTGALITLAPASYQVDDRSEPGWIVPAYGYSWPSTRDMANALTIVYRCGYGTAATDVPMPIRQWLKMQIGSYWANRESDIVDRGFSAVSLGFADRMLDAYRMYDL